MNEQEKNIRTRGRFNVVDVIVILLIVAIAAVAVLKLTKKESANPSLVGAQNYEMQYTVRCPMIDKTVGENVREQVGCQLMSNGEMVEGCYVIDVEILPCNDTYMNSGTLQSAGFEVDDEIFCDVLVTLGGEVPFKDNAFLVGSQEVRLGKPHIVKTKTMELSGTVIEMEGDLQALEG